MSRDVRTDSALRSATVLLVALLGTFVLMLVEERLADLGLSSLPTFQQPERVGEIVVWAILAVVVARGLPNPPRLSPPCTADLLAAGLVAVMAVNIVYRAIAGAGTGDPVGLLVGVVALLALSRLGRRRIERIVVSLLGLVVVGSLAISGLDTATGSGRLTVGLLAGFRPRGLFEWPIAFGASAALLVLLVAAARHGGSFQRGVAVPLVTVSLAALVITDALTATIGLIVAVVVRTLVMTDVGAARTIRRVMTGRAGPLLAASGATVVLAAPFALGLAGGPVSLTGRVPVWEAVLGRLTSRHIWIGIGHEPLDPARGLLTDTGLAWTPVQSHSTPLELFLTAGALGAAAFALLATGLLLTALRTLERTGGWSIAVVSYVLAVWSAEEYLLSLAPADQFLLMCLVACLLAWLRSDGPLDDYRAGPTALRSS